MAVYIWKYTGSNYFDADASYVDKIQINRLPMTSFPIFNFVTEKISGIAQYKTGDFDIRIVIDGGETSVTGVSINNFFRGGTRDYRYVVGIEIGTKQYWGFSTNEYIVFSYLTRTLEITCSRVETEAQIQLNKSFVGTLSSNVTFDYFLTDILVQGISTRLSVTKAFSSYASLIGDAGLIFDYLIQRSGYWVGTLGIWDQFVQLMIGTGLNWKFVYTNSSIIFTDNYPLFNLYIFSLQNLTASTSTLKIIEAEEMSIFRKLEWFYIQYRGWPGWIDIRLSGDVTNDIQDGIVSNGTITYSSDTIRKLPPPRPAPSDYYPGFFTQEGQNGPVATTGTKYTIWSGGPQVIKTFYLGVDTQQLNELALYSYTYNWEGNYSGLNNPDGKTMALVRCLHGSNGFTSVQKFAMQQYTRYIGGLSKRALKVKAVYRGSEDFDLWKTKDIPLDGANYNWYFSEMSSINRATQEIELLFIQT